MTITTRYGKSHEDQNQRPSSPADVGDQGLRAVVHDRYGPPEVLRLEDVERPVPGDDEVLVRVHATTVNRTRLPLRVRRTRASGASSPGCCGRSGGSSGTRSRARSRRSERPSREFTVGHACLRHVGPRLGAHAEYVCAGESGASSRRCPRAMSFAEAAARSGRRARGADSACGARTSRGRPEDRRLRRLRGRSAQRPFSWRGTSAPTSPPCATRRMSSSSTRSEPTGSSTTLRDGLHARTARATTSSSTRSASTRTGAARRSLKPGGVYVGRRTGLRNVAAGAPAQGRRRQGDPRSRCRIGRPEDIRFCQGPRSRLVSTGR